VQEKIKAKIQFQSMLIHSFFGFCCSFSIVGNFFVADAIYSLGSPVRAPSEDLVAKEVANLKTREDVEVAADITRKEINFYQINLRQIGKRSDDFSNVQQWNEAVSSTEEKIRELRRKEILLSKRAAELR
jgi:hypothetical protein